MARPVGKQPLIFLIPPSSIPIFGEITVIDRVAIRFLSEQTGEARSKHFFPALAPARGKRRKKGRDGKYFSSANRRTTRVFPRAVAEIPGWEKGGGGGRGRKERESEGDNFHSSGRTERVKVRKFSPVISRERTGEIFSYGLIKGW